MHKCTSATDSLQLDELELIVCDELSDEMAAVELSCCSLFPESISRVTRSRSRPLKEHQDEQ